MNSENNYLEINKQSWNNKVDTHMESSFYDMKSFLNGATSLNTIELDLLGEISNEKILHLQCHFGQDSISLSRQGAHVTGVDISDVAIDKAQDLAKMCASDAKFICSDVYSCRELIDEKFDTVFTSYGTIGWLPDLDKWADLIYGFLKPRGRLVFVEFHPFVWMFDDNFEKIAYNYFKSDPIIETESGTYADRSAEISQTFVSWNHSLSEVMTSLLKSGFVINDFKEYDYSPYNIFPGMKAISHKKFQIAKYKDGLPLVYSIVAIKK